jgi:hypothetical protein
MYGEVKYKLTGLMDSKKKRKVIPAIAFILLA